MLSAFLPLPSDVMSPHRTSVLHMLDEEAKSEEELSEILQEVGRDSSESWQSPIVSHVM